MASESASSVPVSSSPTGFDANPAPGRRFPSDGDPAKRSPGQDEPEPLPVYAPAAVLVDIDNLRYQASHAPTGNQLVADVVHALRDRFRQTPVFELFNTRGFSDDLVLLVEETHARVVASPRDVDVAIHERATTLTDEVQYLVIVSGDNTFAKTFEDANDRGLRTIAIVDTPTRASRLIAAADEWLTVDDLLTGSPPRSRTEDTAPTPDSEADEMPPSPPEREHVAWLDDQPVDIDADALGRRGVATALEEQLRTLVTDHPERSFLIHIDGPWGAGKSTLMRFVEDRFADTGNRRGSWLVISYDAWRQPRRGPVAITNIAVS